MLKQKKLSWLALALFLCAAFACSTGEGDREEATATDAPAEAEDVRFFVTEFVGGVTRNWFPEEEIDWENPHKSMISYEVTAYPDQTEPTPEQEERAAEFVRESFEAAQRHGWFDYDKGLADGFELMHGDALHFANRDYVMDDELLNPDKPEFLMYYDTASGKRLAGLMFLARTADERGEQFGGPLTIWHYHLWDSPRCLDGELLVCGDPEAASAECDIGEPMIRSPEMLHVWFFNHPHGPYASTMKLPDAVIERLEDRGF